MVLGLPAAAGIGLSHAVSRVGRPVRRSKVQVVKRQLAYPRLGFHGPNRLQHGKGRRGFSLAVNLERNSDAFVDVGGGCEKRLKLRGGGVAAEEDFLT